MDDLYEPVIQQSQQLHDALCQLQHQSRQLSYNHVGIRECVTTLQSCIKKVGNNRIAALSARDMRKVMSEMEEAVERLAEFIR